MARTPRSLPARLGVLCVSLALVAACGDGSGDLEGAEDSQAAPPGSAAERPVPATRAGEVSEISYTLSGAVSESHEEVGTLICSTTPQGAFLAHHVGADWTVSLDVEGTGAGTHAAALRLGPPDRPEFREGDWRRELGGYADGEVTLRDTGVRDGYGNAVVEVVFAFPEVTLERSQAVVGVEGTFRCGVLAQG